MQLSNGTVVVTGAASGIGRATAQRAAAEGASVAVFDRAFEDALETVTLIDKDGGRAQAYEVDVSNEDAVASAIEHVVSDLGPPGSLVTCAGIFDGNDLRPLIDVPGETFLHVLGVNLAGTFYAIKHAMPHLIANNGAVVTIASTAATHGHGFGSGYTASKGGVAALTRLAAVQYGPEGVRCNCICPGGVDTPMTQGVFFTPEAVKRTKARTPLRKVAVPEELASVAVFLLSDDASHVTGQTLTVDGGTTIA
ncbi:MAG: SDR family NAD(P)-dependent oxidoreductase [Acidimicrobiia bacterium]